jgi:glycosyltransferase involved in cell wall biosynthesis
VELEPECYFPVGNLTKLQDRLQQALLVEVTAEQREVKRQWIEETYNWDDIAAKTLAVYRKTLGIDEV